MPAEITGGIGGEIGGDTIEVNAPTTSTSGDTTTEALGWKSPVVMIVLACLAILAILAYTKKG
jgi:hypothetical protein